MPPIWKQIFTKEHELLQSGALKKGELFHTVESLAEKYQVSAITSRRVLHELSREGLLKGVPRVGNVVAQVMTKPQIYLLTPIDMQDQEYNAVQTRMMKGIFEQARDEKFDVLPVTEEFFNHPVDKASFLIYFYSPNSTTAEELEKFSSAKLHMICLHSPGPMALASCVTGNSEELSRVMMEQLFKRGFRRIAYMGPMHAPWFPRRYAGYVQSLIEHQIPLDMNLVFQINKQEISDAEFARLMKLQPRPEVVLFSGNPYAYQFLAYCRRHQIRVPEDISVCSIGSTLPGLTDQELTSVDLCEVEMGKLAIRLIRESLEQEKWTKQTRYVSPTLEVGETLGVNRN